MRNYSLPVSETLITSGILFAGYILSILSKSELLTAQSLSIPYIYITLLLIVHFVQYRRKFSGDTKLLGIALLLAALGLVMIHRLKPALAPYQLLWIAIGMVAMLATQTFFNDIKRLAQYKYLFGLATIILLVSPLLLGTTIGGSKSWIILGPLRIQPSEFAKISMVLFLSGYLSEKRELLTSISSKIGLLVLPHQRYLIPMGIFWLLATLILVLQRDLGASLLIFGTFIVMTYIASSRLSLVFGSLLVFSLGGFISYFVFSHVQIRFDSWLHPWADPSGTGFQLVQSLFAFGSGGIFGSGIGLGHPDLIPEVHTDFVYAAVGEELGLLGSVAVLILYMLFAFKGYYTSLTARDDFIVLLAAGLSTIFIIQTLVIIGGVIKLFPLTGVTLPFVSYGGSSMLANFILLGFLLKVSEVANAAAN